MTASHILSLIESVDPDDTKALDEIDLLMAEFLGFETARNVTNEDDLPPLNMIVHDNGNIGFIDKYTRSRNALKRIRPSGFRIWRMEQRGNIKTFIQAGLDQSDLLFDTPLLQEELAELHAIIQAIEYERGKV